MVLIETWRAAAVREGFENGRSLSEISEETGLSVREVLQREVELNQSRPTWRRCWHRCRETRLVQSRTPTSKWNVTFNISPLDQRPPVSGEARRFQSPLRATFDPPSSTPDH